MSLMKITMSVLGVMDGAGVLAPKLDSSTSSPSLYVAW
jgi:hypothetical protein